MRIVIFGGSFNPPHKGHLSAARAAIDALEPDLFLAIPACLPPHKRQPDGTPDPETRLALCRLNFAEMPEVTVSDMEVQRGGKSFTSDTIRALEAQYPGAELLLLVGTDMFLTLDQWHEPDHILHHAAICALPRAEGELPALREKAEELQSRYGARVRLLDVTPTEASSTEIRAMLPRRRGVAYLTDAVYGDIIRNHLYAVRINYPWLRRKAYAMLNRKRIPHVKGCEKEAVSLAKRWMESGNTDWAATAAILHDCTKKETLSEQLMLCEKYGIIPDATERVNAKLLHAKTGAAIALHEFGVHPEVAEAIRWHTTGRANMKLLEKILYMADYIEPTRNFEGVETLRRLAYEDLDAALLLGLEMSVEDVLSRGDTVHSDTQDAICYLKEHGTPIPEYVKGDHLC